MSLANLLHQFHALPDGLLPDFLLCHFGFQAWNIVPDRKFSLLPNLWPLLDPLLLGNQTVNFFPYQILISLFLDNLSEHKFCLLVQLIRL